MKHFKKHHPAIVKKLQAGLATDKKSGFKDLKKYIERKGIMKISEIVGIAHKY